MMRNGEKKREWELVLTVTGKVRAKTANRRSSRHFGNFSNDYTANGICLNICISK